MRAWLSTVAALAALVACDDQARQTQPEQCDPVANEGCPAGDHCRVVSGGGTACLPLESVASGCAASSCPAGQSCLRVEGWEGCRDVCRVEDGAGCPDACVYRVGEFGAWGACAADCRLGTCPGELTCAPVPVWDRPVCVTTGEAGQGEPCELARCQAGLACLALDGDPRCLRVCDPETQVPCEGACNGVITNLTGLSYCTR